MYAILKRLVRVGNTDSLTPVSTQQKEAFAALLLGCDFQLSKEKLIFCLSFILFGSKQHVLLSHLFILMNRFIFQSDPHQAGK